MTWRVLFGMFILAVMASPTLLFAPTAEAGRLAMEGMDSVSYRNMVVGEKTTFVAYDPNGIVDDYAYMAAVPASVFYSDSNDKVVAHPLLFWEDPNSDISLNSNQGINYFMDDVSTISTEGLDMIETINLDETQQSTVTTSWPADKTHAINSDDPAVIAADIAAFNWEYSDTAVVAVIEDDITGEEVVTSGTLTGETPGESTKTGTFEGSQDPSPVNAVYHDFDVPEGYKYIHAKMTWGNGPAKEVLQRGKDPDLQIYDNQLGQVAASAEWNVISGASEEIGSYVYNDGSWSFAVTYMPTQSPPPYELDEKGHAISYGMDEPLYYGYDPIAGDYIYEDPRLETRGPVQDAVEEAIEEEDDPDRLPFMSTVMYTIDYTLYPGVEIPLPEETPYACRDASFTLSWSGSQNLGLILLGPSGAEISTALSSASSQTIEVNQLGEGQYSIAVVNLGSSASPTEFSIDYSWRQIRPDEEGDLMNNAVNGAVLASKLNAPLLYATTKGVPSATKDTLDLLGVKKVYLVDTEEHGGKGVRTKLTGYRSFLEPGLRVTHIKDSADLYERIVDTVSRLEGDNADVVFTTLDPHSIEEAGNDAKADQGGNPIGEEPGGLYVGPAAYEAAVHGCPCFIVEVHSELSCSQAWNNEFWRYAYPSRLPPSVGCMILTGRAVYEFLEEHNIATLDNDPESIITVAGQFDIGTAWDRAFVGAAYAGRIQGTPGDTAYWVSRTAFYNDLIWANPAVNKELDEHGGKRIQGSSSTRVGGVLTITEPEKEEVVDYPITMTWASYQHRFNERAADYWGCKYTTRTDITPYETPSDESIDPNGVWPDIHTSEIVPYYSEECGYGSVYTTAVDQTCENMNRGSVLWLEVMHGGNRKGGIVGFWDTEQKEENPWRGYEEVFPIEGSRYGGDGATGDPDVISMSRQIGIDAGILGVTGPGGFVETHDGIIIAIVQQWQTVYVDGFMLDERWENLHSMGFSGGSCLIANSYMHTTMVRHGMVFQVVDPWLTSWYSTFAMECFMRDFALDPDMTVGKAYTNAISHVGILYLIDGWWWDIYENLVFYGDPDMKVWTPQYGWNMSTHMAAGTSVDGHNIYGAKGHPNEIQANFLIVGVIVGGVIVAVGAAAAVVLYTQKNKLLGK